METEIKSKILHDLNQLLEDGLSPHSISYQFEKIALVLSKENLHIEKTDCKDYYNDEELALILIMKNEALANAQFEQASKFLTIEKELLLEKGHNEYTTLKTEPYFFEYRQNGFLFHCNKRLENQRLIANLIEGYSLGHQQVASGKMLSY
ncbi:MAG: hypothetical protein JWP81_4422 [Ferruginibacter sp.]|nr:hypothetical protein [Ferruginibacter sp.]